MHGRTASWPDEARMPYRMVLLRLLWVKDGSCGPLSGGHALSRAKMVARPSHSANSGVSALTGKIVVAWSVRHRDRTFRFILLKHGTARVIDVFSIGENKFVPAIWQEDGL